MQPVRLVAGRMAPLDRTDVDTDQIIPKQFLKRIERTGYGPFLFYDWRQEPSFFLSQPQFSGAKVLVAGANFGCGSSREHATWAACATGSTRSRSRLPTRKRSARMNVSASVTARSRPPCERGRARLGRRELRPRLRSPIPVGARAARAPGAAARR